MYEGLTASLVAIHSMDFVKFLVNAGANLAGKALSVIGASLSQVASMEPVPNRGSASVKKDGSAAFVTQLFIRALQNLV
ncbi:UNVERIFIED_CONTAM: hypothetical protein K2H54_026136 [Gekko kuhli]